MAAAGQRRLRDGKEEGAQSFHPAKWSDGRNPRPGIKCCQGYCAFAGEFGRPALELHILFGDAPTRRRSRSRTRVRERWWHWQMWGSEEDAGHVRAHRQKVWYCIRELLPMRRRTPNSIQPISNLFLKGLGSSRAALVCKSNYNAWSCDSQLTFYVGVNVGHICGGHYGSRISCSLDFGRPKFHQ